MQLNNFVPHSGLHMLFGRDKVFVQAIDELSAETMEELWRSLKDVDQRYIQTSNEYDDIYQTFRDRQQVITEFCNSTYSCALKI